MAYVVIIETGQRPTHTGDNPMTDYMNDDMFWNVYAAAKDNKDMAVVAAVFRMMKAARNDKPAHPADVSMVYAFA